MPRATNIPAPPVAGKHKGKPPKAKKIEAAKSTKIKAKKENQWKCHLRQTLAEQSASRGRVQRNKFTTIAVDVGVL